MPTKKKEEQEVRKFESDCRDNPRLHNLHVNWSYQWLTVAMRAKEELSSFSQVQPTMVLSKMWDAVQEEATRDAATFEAAALLFLGLNPPPQ